MKKYAALLLLLLAAACASDGDKKDKHDEATKPPAESKLKTEDLICPQVAILQPAQETFDYGRESPDESQLVAKAKLNKIDGDCAYQSDKDNKTKSGIDIAFTVHMMAARGPRLGGSQASFPYFIAVVDPSDDILSRQVVTAKFNFSGSDKVATNDDAMHVFIPLDPKAQIAGPGYRVLIGFTKSR